MFPTGAGPGIFSAVRLSFEICVFIRNCAWTPIHASRLRRTIPSRRAQLSDPSSPPRLGTLPPNQSPRRARCRRPIAHRPSPPREAAVPSSIAAAGGSPVARRGRRRPSQRPPHEAAAPALPLVEAGVWPRGQPSLSWNPTRGGRWSPGGSARSRGRPSWGRHGASGEVGLRKLICRRRRGGAAPPPSTVEVAIRRVGARPGLLQWRRLEVQSRFEPSCLFSIGLQQWRRLEFQSRFEPSCLFSIGFAAAPTLLLQPHQSPESFPALPFCSQLEVIIVWQCESWVW